MEQTRGQKVKAAREARGLLQKELGHAVGRTESWVNKFEKDQIENPRGDTLARMARALELPELVPHPVASGPHSSPAVAQDGVRDKFDAAIVADLLGELSQIAPRETLDVLREMSEAETTAFYRYAVRELAAAMRANMRYGGKMLRLRWNGRETDIPLPE